jgi:hypothetical protein
MDLLPLFRYHLDQIRQFNPILQYLQVFHLLDQQQHFGVSLGLGLHSVRLDFHFMKFYWQKIPQRKLQDPTRVRQQQSK